MANAYQDPKTAQKYLDFLNSKDGQIQQKVLLEAILSRLDKNHRLKLLDAGCGPGWLAGALKKDFADVEACDGSAVFINFAKKRYPDIDFKIAELDGYLPYKKNYFDAAILNMVGPDLIGLVEAFKNLFGVLKPDGKLIMTIPNPGLTYPAAEWKKGWLDILLGRKPKLKINKFLARARNIHREFGKNSTIASNYYPLADYVLSAQRGGLKLTKTLEIKSQTDSKEFDLNYQLYRYPLLLLLEFEK